MKRQRLTVLLVLVCLIAVLLPVTVSAAIPDGFSDDGYRYYRDGQMVVEEIIEHDGKLYAFDYNGWLYTAQGFWMGDDYYRAREDGSLYVNEWYGGSYFGEGGKAARDFQQIDGVWYFFDIWGDIACEEPVWSESYQAWYWMSEDGTSHTRLPAEKWYQDSEGEWYYFSKDGSAPFDFVKIGNKWYYLGYRCQLQRDCIVWSDMDQKYYALSPDGESYQVIPEVTGWHQAYGKWYYALMRDGSLDFAYDEVIEDQGKKYYLDYDGQMVTNDFCEVYDYENYRWVYLIADKDGVLSDSGWYNQDGSWRYLLEGDWVYDGIYEINGKMYLFRWYYLVTEMGEQYYNGNNYWVKNEEGELLRNDWVKKEICWPSEKGWTYYGNDAAAVYNQIVTINGKLYGFDDGGVMLENSVESFEDGVYMFDKDGVGKKLTTGWYQDPVDGGWLYVMDGYMPDSIEDVDGKTYAFSSGYMICNEIYYGDYNGNYGQYLFGADGVMVKKTGWHYQNGWYFLNADYTVYEGWLQSGGKWYFMYPVMISDVLYYEEAEQVTYAIDSNGVATALKKNGLERVLSLHDYAVIYLQNGKAITNTWKQVGGYWYYFGSNGMAYRDDIFTIGENQYIFNYSGQLGTGWVYMYGNWFYADPANDSALSVGLKTIGGEKYIFNEYGAMKEGGWLEYEGVTYLLAGDGHVLTTMAPGWNQYKGEWYYVDEYGQLACDEIIKDNGKYYYLDECAKMRSGGLVNCGWRQYYINADGVIQTGWHKINGQWMYWFENEDQINMAYGTEYIDDKQYVFTYDGYLRIGTFFHSGWIYTTNSDGKVIKETMADDGWYYEGGSWFYMQNGYYTGWIGDYYIDEGVMMYNTVIEYNGKHYFIQPNGLLLRNGWGQAYDSYYFAQNDWVLARADGSLYCSEWAWSNGAWYYFMGHYMVSNTIEKIDGAYHQFDENGKWLGEVDGYYDNRELPTGKPDGWQKISGKWYYFKDGTARTGELYWNGNRYLLDYDTGAMVVNAVGEAYNAYRYYNADGVAVEYVGWKQIDGNWYLFNPDSTLRTGLAEDSAGLCYIKLRLTKDGRLYCTLAKNEYIRLSGGLYYFNASGYTKGAISTNGWYQAGKVWCYFENGAFVDYGHRSIGGADYFFLDGRMATNEVVHYDGAYHFAGKDGKVVTTQGWYQDTEGRWVYVRKDGTLYQYGIYSIGGKEYTFYNGVLISE